MKFLDVGRGNGFSQVAPARGRGLKLEKAMMNAVMVSRPRKGAWIEISGRMVYVSPFLGSPPQGGVD